MRFHQGAAVTVVASLVGCATAQHALTSDDVSGLSLPLLTDGGIRWAVAGRVPGGNATVIFDTSRELSTATPDCFEDENPPLLGNVNVSQPSGSVLQTELATLSGLSLGATRYRDFKVAVESHRPQEKGCTVRLGLELLGPYALEYQAREARLKIRRALTDAQVLHWREQVGAPLTLGKTHQHEWLLWTTRLQQGARRTTATLMLDTGNSQSRLSERLVNLPNAAGGLLSLKAMARGVGETEGPTVKAYGDEVFVQAWELAPRIEARSVWAVATEKWRPDLDGAVGGDVWGAFDMLLDVSRGFVWLSAPTGPAPSSPAPHAPAALVERYFKWLEQQPPHEGELPEPAEP